MTAPVLVEMRVERRWTLAEGIAGFELRPVRGDALPPFTAGAHIDLYLPVGVRSYSLVNDPGERDRYVIAVNRDAAGRGGSVWLHDALAVGATLLIGAPRNNFPLAEEAAASLFIAGGIGITPLYAMVCRLAALGRSWALVYCARTRVHAAFRDELAAFGAAVRFNFDQEPGGRLLDIDALVAQTAPQTHLYCCGPVAMLQAFERATADRPSDHIHVEYFAGSAPAATEGSYTVVLERSRRSLLVRPGKTIIDTLIEAGIDTPYSCLEGVCGTCETRVIAGTPDHRDLVLSKGERAANRTMMICCSGAKSDTLVLDL